VVQHAGRPPLAFSGPHLEEGAFVSSDGARLAMTTWAPADGAPWAVIIALHGMNSYAAAFHAAGPYWAEHGIVTLAYDQRGFGRNRDQRGVWPGTALLTEDLRVIVALAHARYPNALIAIAGASMGGSVAIEALASDRPPAVDRLVLLSPGIWGWREQSPAASTGLWMLGHTIPGVRVRPPGWLVNRFAASDNAEEVAQSAHDPLVIWSMRPDSLYGLIGLMNDAANDIGRTGVPTAYLYGANDHVMPRPAAFAAVRRLAPSARTAYYPEGWHWLLLDRQAPAVWADVVAFLRDPATPWPSGAQPIPAVPSGPAAAGTSGSRAR
jgi:alpha-beta hydrolase superfamily lysophospholipase